MLSTTTPDTMWSEFSQERAATLAQYDADIDALYHNLAVTALTDIAVPTAWTTDATLDYVREVVHHVLPVVTSDADDLFDRGCTRCVPSCLPFVV